MPPSILAVTSHVPWPADSGGALRTFHVLRALAGRFAVRLVVPSTGDRDAAAREALTRAGITPVFVRVPPRRVVSEAMKAAAAAASGQPYVLFARHRRTAVTRALAAEAAKLKPDVLYLDHLDSLVYADAAPGATVVVDMHNVYSQLARRASAESGGALRRRYLAREGSLLASKERLAARIAHAILAVSDDDARYFTSIGAARVALVPNGVDCAAFETAWRRRGDSAPTLLYVGSLQWPPNAMAAAFLAKTVLPRVRRAVPGARLIIVGRRPTPEVRALASGDDLVEVAADVADVAPFYARADVLAVPLEAGGGTRLKILEAFAARVPVVSTPVGCEGIDAIDGTHLIVADRDRFADAIVGVLRDPDAARARTERAHQLARDVYDWTTVGARAVDAVSQAAGDVRRGAPAAVRFAARVSAR